MVWWTSLCLFCDTPGVTRIEADRIVRSIALRSEGDGERLLAKVADLDPEVAIVARQRLAEIGAASLASLAQSAAA